MRRLALAACALAIACASIQAPPGGPLRTTPPVLVSVTPDSGALNVQPDKVVFTFDEVVSDRPSGAALLDNLFIVSPQQGAPDVSWKRSRIEIKAHKGFRPNTAYSVTMLPGITDQRSNILHSGKTIVFSTGPTIPPFSIRGRVFDWIREAVAPRAFVEAIAPDSVRYLAVADSMGQFVLGPLPNGTYTVRATIDVNSNRALDRTEAWDSVHVVVSDTVPYLELLAALRDTAGARVLTATAGDSVTLAVSFDQPIAAASVSPEHFRLVSATPDSTPLRITGVLTRAAAAAARAAADSAARARDTTRSDSARKAAAARDSATRRLSTLTRPDTVRQIRPSRPAPQQDVVIQLDPATPMRANASYRVTAIGVRNLAGTSHTSDRVFTMTPPPSAPPAARTPPATPAMQPSVRPARPPER